MSTKTTTRATKYFVVMTLNRDNVLKCLPRNMPFNFDSARGYGFKQRAAADRHAKGQGEVYSVQGVEFNGLKTSRDHEALRDFANRTFS